MGNLSDAEMYAWNFMEENKSRIQLMSITKIAEEAHVSTATIVRTLKKKEFDGFSDFKNSLKRTNNGEGSGYKKIVGLSDEANKYIFKNLIEVSRTIGLLNPQDLENISKDLIGANTIMMIARGYSEDVSDNMMHRLQTLGKSVVSRYYDDMCVYSEQLTKEDMVFIISPTGEDKLIVSAAKKAKKKGTKVVVLTSNYHSQLTQISDYYILAHQSKLEREELYGDAGSTISLGVICRVLIDMFIIYREKGTIRG